VYNTFLVVKFSHVFHLQSFYLITKDKEFLLSIYICIQSEKSILATWIAAKIVSILKPGKDHSHSTSFRPMCLTNCVCKTREQMVNPQLLWILESRHLHLKAWHGLWHHRSILDHLVNLEHYIRNCSLIHQHLIAVFFNLEKAHYTTWWYGILRTLYRLLDIIRVWDVVWQWSKCCERSIHSKLCIIWLCETAYEVLKQ
jgi:hypothetical protein